MGFALGVYDHFYFVRLFPGLFVTISTLDNTLGSQSLQIVKLEDSRDSPVFVLSRRSRTSKSRTNIFVVCIEKPHREKR